MPWIMLSKFRNVVKGLPISDSNVRLGEVNVRNVEYYTTERGRIITPASSSLMIPSFIKVYTEEEMDEDYEETKIIVKNLEGYVYGFMFDGTYFRVDANKLLGNGIDLQKKKNYSDYELNDTVKKVLRLRAGKLFTAYNKSILRKRYGIELQNTGIHGGIKKLIINNKSIIAREDFETSFFTILNDKEEIKYPGVMSALLSLIYNKKVYPSGKTREIIDEFLKELSTVGKSVAPFSEAILQATGNNAFVYNLGEIKMKEKDKERYRREGQSNRIHLFSKWLDKLVYGEIYANANTDKVYLDLSFYPNNTVAQIEFNYPPFSVLPLSAVVYSKKDAFDKLINGAKTIANKNNIDLTLDSKDFDVLANAGVSTDDIAKAMKEGYPKIDTLLNLLDKSSKLSNIGDIFNLLMGKANRVDTILVSIDRISSEKEDEDEANKVKL